MKIAKLFVAIAAIFATAQALAIRPLYIMERWGGNGIQLQVWSNRSAQMTFSCAAGHVDSGWIYTNGKLTAKGMYTKHTGVRPPVGVYRPESVPAQFAVNVNLEKGTMTLKMRTANGEKTFQLRKNEAGSVAHCM